MTNLAPYRKTLIAIAAVLGAVVSAAVLPPEATRWVQLVLSVLGALGVYAISNVPGEAPAVPTTTEPPASTTVSSPPLAGQ